MPNVIIFCKILNSDTLTPPENQTKIYSTFDIIRYGKIDTISKMGGERNFIDLINGVPSIANQGYNKKELSIIMFDIDHFKKINDEHGHDVGDHALVALIKIVKTIIRDDDVFIRWGGEEFILLVESNLEKACLTDNKLQQHIELKTAELNGIPAFTCSFGVVSMQGFSSFDQAYKIVDEKLYLAKNNGRNRVEY